METELRRSRSTLRILGTGVIVFTVWSVLKTILLFLLIPLEQTPAGEISDKEAVVLLIIFLAIFLFIILDLLVRLRLGFCARAEGLGKHRGTAYVVFAFIYFFFQIFIAALSFYQLLRYGLVGQSIPEAAASLLLEISSVVTMGEMAFTAVKVKRLSALCSGSA